MAHRPLNFHNTLFLKHSALTLVPSPFVFEASKPTLVAILLLVFEPKNIFVNSIATLFQHVFKQNVEEMYFYF